jgi:hypothetical protein
VIHLERCRWLCWEKAKVGEGILDGENVKSAVLITR